MTDMSGSAAPPAGPARPLGRALAFLRGSWPLIPAALFLAVAFVYPVALLLGRSFVGSDGGISAENYFRLGESTVVVRVMLITFKIAGWTTLFAIIAGYPIAYLLATLPASRRNLLAIFVLMPFWTSFLVRTFAWIVLLGRNGALNQLLHALGVSDPPSFLYQFSGVMIGMVHALMPLCVLTMLSVMENIDKRLTDAAGTLGARPAAAFWRIYFPLSLPGAAAGGLLVFITSLGFFITPALLGSERETVIVQLVIFQIKEMLNWGFAGAIAIMLLVVALVIFYVYDRLVGLSTLSGGDVRSSSGRQNPLSWLGAKVGNLLLTAISEISDAVGRALGALMPSRPDRKPRRIGGKVLRIVALAGIAFLAVPAFFVIPVSFSESQFLGWPPEGFSLQWYREVFDNPLWIGAAWRSFVVAFSVAVVALILGVPAAFYLVRRARRTTAIMAFLISPLIMPHIIIAVALFYLFAQIGLVGTTIGLIIGHTVLAIPYVVVTVVAVLKNYDIRLDQAASTLGANGVRTFLNVTFPLIRSGLIAAFMFAFIISFDELTISLFVTGGQVTTLPKQMWDDALLRVSPALAAVATLILAFMTAVILGSEILRRRGVTKQ
ncbi:ABC-type spermidine/putrescine transport system permease subunit I [Rhodopseudomonas julia]|uniref:ABC-type spermidine/putrescine transport system permease subunit I n=1 Tax=Rhodopseudomonas julia TaxID=200617 RepID=A0ABU0C379_9BRAD|nr:ABC transporter permease subunit [Rhodopseudomonas julia]MDQ0324653.1 ABC-type spermidine/putrescine transport system permease subunit I [Rhodopseudomonas julia]